jgi:small subunit ribosomal protein S4
MGDPKKLRKKYATPIHPWNKVVIDANKLLKQEYGLRNRKEILRANSFLKKYKDIAKRLTANKTAQGEIETKHVLNKLQNLGILSPGSDLDHILALKVNSVLDRRLQTVLMRNNLARTSNQARQFIVHRHVSIGGKEITAPSYLVTTKEENMLAFKPKSALADEEHPERVNLAKEIKEEKEKTLGKSDDGKNAETDDKKSEIKKEKSNDKKKVEIKVEETKSEEKVEKEENSKEEEAKIEDKEDTKPAKETKVNKDDNVKTEETEDKKVDDDKKIEEEKSNDKKDESKEKVEESNTNSEQVEKTIPEQKNG